ncbi:hypothetical protein BZL30_3019 [Mycobacterium kansasii]|uniref:Uncharacterized protein n=1 Tax=Mycobacterium kansasii TaxID=1768 RepID=A0A1V3XIE2_MYCKA|nr:hypothetical protein BZL30_3019 [Mycobacterium kansasii]
MAPALNGCCAAVASWNVWNVPSGELDFAAASFGALTTGLVGACPAYSTSTPKSYSAVRATKTSAPPFRACSTSATPLSGIANIGNPGLNFFARI